MTLQTIIISAGALILTLTAIAFALPSKARVERSLVINADSEKVFALVAGNRGFQKFNPWRDSDPKLEIDLFGPEHGVGSGFRFSGKDGKGTQTITAVEPRRSVTMQLDLGSMGKPVQQFTLEPARNGTRVVWGMDAEFGNNPIARVFGLFMDRMMGSTFERGLDNLSTAAGRS